MQQVIEHIWLGMMTSLPFTLVLFGSIYSAFHIVSSMAQRRCEADDMQKQINELKAQLKEQGK